MLEIAVVGNYVKLLIQMEKLNEYPTVAKLGVILGKVRGIMRVIPDS